MVNYGVHPLDGGIEREIRAEEHLTELGRELAKVFQRQADAIPFDLDPNPPHAVMNVGLPPETFFGMRIGILVGEICYNLRAALDYLVFELANRDSGAPQSGTQFPIMDTPKSFGRRGKASMLKGVNLSHVAMIEKLQPYNGCTWTKRLRDFSNEDKHRQFIVAGGRSRATVWSSLDTDLSRISGFDRTAIHPATKCKVQMKVHIAGSVAFDDGLPILDTITELKNEVADCLADFKAQF